MKDKILFLIVLVFCSCIDKKSYQHSAAITSEICVYGATSAGIVAAIEASESKSVVLIATGKHLGGMTIDGLGGSDIDNHRDFQNSQAVGGKALEFYRRIAMKYNRLDEFDSSYDNKLKNPQLWTFEPHIAEEVFIEWLKNKNITVFYENPIEESPEAVHMINRKINHIRTVTGKVFKADVFVDATYEGDLLAASRVSYAVGRESNNTYNETQNGIRCENDYRQFAVRVDPYVIEGVPSSGLIHTVQDEQMGDCGGADKRIQAYCFRMCLTSDTTNQIPFARPKNYRPEWYEIYRRYLRAGGELYTPKSRLPMGKTDLGAWHDLSHNLYGFNHGYPEGSYAERDSIYRYHKEFTAGLFYFLSHDDSISEALRNEWSKWGLAKDEFEDNNGWPRKLYIRDGRRMVSDYVITQANTRKSNKEKVSDAVGVAFWPPDVHHVRRIVKDGAAYNEGFVFGGENWAPFGISYRSLVPKKSECINIITPTCVSSSHIAFGAIRLEWTFMVLGQSAGAAAALAIENSIGIQDVPYNALESRLRTDGQVLQL